MADPRSLEPDDHDHDPATAAPETTTGTSADPRPSFIDYWQRSKQEEAARNITFVPSNPQHQQAPADDNNGQQAPSGSSGSGGGGSGGPGPGPGGGGGRDLARRSQVRKAQVRHRQRKANYTKQLEMDIAKLRELIEDAERAGAALRGENEVFRLRLARAPRPPPPLPPTVQATTSSGGGAGVGVGAGADVNMTSFAMAPSAVADFVYSAPPPPEYTVHFDISDVMNTPVFQVERCARPVSSGGAAGPEPGFGTETFQSADTGGTGLTEAQTDQAINFILALEHICWDHFDPSYFTHASYDPTANEHGHALMASAIALQSAPTSVFTQIDGVQRRLRGHPEDPASAIPTVTGDDNGISWQSNPATATAAAGLSLQGLYGLASTLNPPDRELAPVQAWFEIVRLYGVDVVLDALLMERVKAEFAGVVKCLHFGAVIERDAFDSVLARVIGPCYMDVDEGAGVGVEGGG
ncbi:hypothetical protein F5B20DRAFT_528273 [Whalleya microplaca]|nr:hypothetical protein F5B20DRAFT_528273 [Whalleya microplaca]